MAKRGRKPAPTALKIARGTQASRINRAEPAPVPGIPDCPEHLDATARAEWARMTPILAAMGVLTLKDGPALAIYCSAHSEWVQAEKRLKSSRYVKTARGGLQLHPAAKVSRDARAIMLKVLAEFGCTPSSAGGIKVDPAAGPKDELAAFLEGQA